MKKFLGLVCIVIFVVGCGSKETVSSEAVSPKKARKDAIQQAAEFLAQKDVRKAGAVLRAAIEQNPQDIRAHFMLGQIFMQAKEFTNAMGSFEKIIAIEPDNGRAYYLLGSCYELSGDAERAAKEIGQSVKIFQEKRDAANFKKSLTALQRLAATIKSSEKTDRINDKQVSSVAGM